MNQIKKLLFGICFIIIISTLLINILASTIKQKQSVTILPYLSGAFVQCTTQKIENYVHKLGKTGGYPEPALGIANEITMEKAIEGHIEDVLGSCEDLLEREEIFVRHLHDVRAIVETKAVEIFFNGFWEGKSGRIIPGFIVRLDLPLGESAFVARDAIRTIEESGMIRNTVLENLGKNINENFLKHGISHSINKLLFNLNEYNISFNTMPEQISLNRIKREISFPLKIAVKRDDYEFYFEYMIILTQLDLMVGCDIIDTTTSRLPHGNEIIYDCGWYTCQIPWREKIFLPKLCGEPVIYVDGKEVGKII